MVICATTHYSHSHKQVGDFTVTSKQGDVKGDSWVADIRLQRISSRESVSDKFTNFEDVDCLHDRQGEQTRVVFVVLEHESMPCHPLDLIDYFGISPHYQTLLNLLISLVESHHLIIGIWSSVCYGFCCFRLALLTTSQTLTAPCSGGPPSRIQT